MIAPLSALDAYRGDRASAGVDVFTPVDAELTQIAELLTRCTQLPRNGASARVNAALRAECARLAQSVAEALDIRSPDQITDRTPAAVAAVLRAAASLLEDTEALRFANALLFLADRVLGADAGVIEQGRILAQRARVARKIGDQKASMTLYGLVRDMAEREASPELHARAHVGFAVLARARGNIPLMTEHARAALEYGVRSQLPELLAMGHRSMMLASAAVGKLDDAVLHAWGEYSVFRGDPAREVNALLTVAQAVLDYGEPAIALRAFAVVLRRPLPKRAELPCLGGAAVAAAKVGERRLVARIVRRIDDLTASTGHPFDSLSSRAEAVMALTILRDATAEVRRQAVLEEAEAAGFHEIAYRMAHLTPPKKASSPAPLASVELREVLAGLEEVSSGMELQTAF
ncbi:MAG: hypothetical protein V4550_10395 [Gemmatimonadota bacterium]